MKTTWISENDIKRNWYIVDVEGIVLGRASTRIASLLIGKNKVNQVPNMDNGDYVIVVNCEKISVTGRKMSDKMYQRHSGFPGGFKEETLSDLLKRDPKKVILTAVKNMLPNNKLRAGMISRLYVYEGEEHPHSAQKPVKINLKK
jgi:large subunit ribosomal protein L13